MKIEDQDDTKQTKFINNERSLYCAAREYQCQSYFLPEIQTAITIIAFPCQQTFLFIVIYIVLFLSTKEQVKN